MFHHLHSKCNNELRLKRICHQTPSQNRVTLSNYGSELRLKRLCHQTPSQNLPAYNVDKLLVQAPTTLPSTTVNYVVLCCQHMCCKLPAKASNMSQAPDIKWSCPTGTGNSVQLWGGVAVVALNSEKQKVQAPTIKMSNSQGNHDHDNYLFENNTGNRGGFAGGTTQWDGVGTTQWDGVGMP